MSWSFRPCTAQGGRSDGPIQQIDARSSRPGPDHALCLSGPGSTRHAEPTHPQSSPVRDLWLFGGIWNDLCRRAGLDRDAQTSIKRRHEPKDGNNQGRFSDPIESPCGELAAPFGVCCREGRSCSELPKTVREKFSDSSCVGKGKRAGQCPPRRATFSENRSCVVVVDVLG